MHIQRLRDTHGVKSHACIDRIALFLDELLSTTLAFCCCLLMHLACGNGQAVASAHYRYVTHGINFPFSPSLPS